MKIMEFKLENFNGDEKEVDMKEAFDVLFDIYRRVLNEDENWHFFYEGDYSFLRCGENYQNRVTRLLGEHKIKYKNKEWEEPFKFTRKMQEQFSLVFHSLSVLVMELYYKNMNITEELIAYSADRVIHPFLNMATYLQHFTEDEFLDNWEANVLANLTASRAYNVGRRIGWYDRVKYEKQNKEVINE